MKTSIEAWEGRSVRLGGLGVVFKMLGSETGGAFSIVEHPVDPRRLVLPHVHQNEDEYSYVLEGPVGARVGESEISLGRAATSSSRAG